MECNFVGECCMNNVWQTISTAQVLKIVWIGTIGACFLLSSLLGVVFLVGGDISINQSMGLLCIA
jgi:hypothetical protein